MRIHYTLLSSLAVTAWAMSPAAQAPPSIERIDVGSASVSASFLVATTEHWKETLVNVQNIAIERGLWTDELTRVDIAGRPALRRHINVVTPEGKFREEVDLTVDARTFAPIRTTERNGAGLTLAFDFDGPRLKGERVTPPESAVRQIQWTAPMPFFDYYGGMMDLFLATLPFKPGYRATFPATMATTAPGADPSEIHWPIVQVMGEEDVRSGGAIYKAWRVEVNTPYGFYRVWARKEPPYVVKTILLIPPGGRITYELTS